MLSFFKKLFSSKKEDSSPRNTGNIVPLEIQIEKLKEIGFSLSNNLSIDFLLNEFDRSVYESDPFGCLLFTLGSEHQDFDGVWKQNSNDIFTFDTECVEDNGSYISIMKKFSSLAQGAFDICNIKDSVDFNSKKAWVSFDFQGKNYKRDLRLDDDWFDTKLIDMINDLLRISGSKKRFYTYSPDQNLLVVFQDENGIKQLADLTTFEFK